MMCLNMSAVLTYGPLATVDGHQSRCRERGDRTSRSQITPIHAQPGVAPGQAEATAHNPKARTSLDVDQGPSETQNRNLGQ